MSNNRQALQSRRSTLISVLAILLLAFWVRLAYFQGLHQIYPDFLASNPFCGLDANAYHHVYARGFLKGTWPGESPFFHMILYPYFLSGVYTLVGINLRVVVIFHILLEVLACAALFGIGRLILSKTTGLLASLFLAFYGPLIFFNPCFAQIALTIPLYSLTIFFLLKAEPTDKVPYLIIAGVATGLTALSRPTFFLIIPIVMLWWLFNRIPLRRIVLRGTIYIATVFIITLPATAHNYRTGGHPLPTPISGWDIFFLGNNPVAEGMGFVDYVLFNHLDVVGEEYVNSVFERAKQQSQLVYRDEALEFIKSNPIGWLELLWRKTYLLLGESDNNLISPYFTHDLQTVPFLQYFPLGWRSVFIGALLGMVFVKHRHRGLILSLFVLLSLFTILFHIQYRFRLLFVPLVLLYLAALVVTAPRLNYVWFRLSLVILAIGTLFLPELGWILGLFGISALWPHVKYKQWPVLRWSALAAWGFVIAILLLRQIIAFNTQTEQRQTIFRGPSIVGPIAIGQSFVVHCDGFNRVSLNLGIIEDSRAQPATFHLRFEKDNLDDIYTAAFDITGKKDRTWYDFAFPSQAGSSGQSYFLFVDAPQATQAEAIMLRGTYDQPFDRYLDGEAYIGQSGKWQAIPGDLAFSARCEAGLLELVNQSFNKLAEDNGFGSSNFYWVVLIGHLSLLVFALLKLRKLTNPGNSLSYKLDPN